MLSTIQTAVRPMPKTFTTITPPSMRTRRALPRLRIITLVVSPLIALMKDQVDALRARGIPAVALTSQAGAEEQRDILDGIRAGVFTLVYVAPERFRSPRFVEALFA